jgi:hypothetical protein
MHSQNISFRSDIRGLKENLSLIQKNLDLEESEWLKLIQLQKTEYHKILNENPKIKYESVRKLSSNIGISEDSLICGDFDLETLLRHLKGDEAYIAKKYQKQAYSNVATINNVLNYIEHNFGNHVVGSVLKELQIRPYFLLKNKNQKVNVSLLFDVLNSLAKRGFDLSNFPLLGRENILRSKFKINQIVKKPKDIFEVLSDFTARHVEENWRYKITKMTDEFCIFKAEQNEKLSEHFKNKKYGNIFMTQFRVGFINSAPLALGINKSANVKTMKTIHEGYDADYYLVEYSHLKHLCH